MKIVPFGSLALLALAACAEREAAPPAPRPAVVMTLSHSAEAGALAYPGEVRARHEVDLGFRIGGKLVARPVSLGERVRAGQVLARLDPQDVQLAASAAQAQVAAAEADLALAQAEFERAKVLAAQQFISATMVDTRRTQLEASQARLAQARAQQGAAANQVGYASLLAPRDGVVTALPVEVGQVLAAGQVAVRVADPAALEVLAWIPESRIGQLQAGQAALVRLWHAPQKTYAGTLREVAASADGVTRTYAVRVALQNADAAFHLGATAGVAFPGTAELGQGFALPLSAVVRGNGQARVWVVDAQQRVSARPVTVLAFRDETAFVSGALQDGERIVTLGAHTLREGEAIQPLDASAPVALDVAR